MKSIKEKIKKIANDKKTIDKAKAIYTAYIEPNKTGIITTAFNGIKWVLITFLRPFWFSSTKKSLVAPYVYVFISMVLYYISVYVFLDLCYTAANPGIKDAAIILPTLAGVIATLIAINQVMISAYNKGKDKTEISDNYESDKPKGVQ